MDKDIESIIPIIQKWASTVPYNIKVYLYGSRITGNPKQADRDLDIAIEFKDQLDAKSWLELEVTFSKYWAKQLTINFALPYKPHIETKNPSEFYTGHEICEFLTTNGYCLVFDSCDSLFEKAK